MNIILKEALLVIVLGVVPALILLNELGVMGFGEHLKFQSVNERVFYYFFSFFVAHFSLGILYKFYFGKVAEARKGAVSKFVTFVQESASAFLSIYRIAAGFLLVAVGVLWFHSQSPLSNTQSLRIFVLSAIFVLASFSISWFYESTKVKP